MKTVIRCHVKNMDRLDILVKTITSVQHSGIKDIYLLDDSSPMQTNVKDICTRYNLHYCNANNNPSTINGLIESLKLAEDNEPILCLVDDITVHYDLTNKIEEINNLLPRINFNYGTIGMFACYPYSIRDARRIEGLNGIWNIEWDILYALNCHIYSPELTRIAIEEWEGVLRGDIPNPCCCDDIFIARLCKKHKLTCLNTYHDYAWHTGANFRTFENDNTGNSNYQTECFAPE